MVSISSVHGLALSKSRHFVLNHFLAVFVFGLIYYSLQYFDSQPFVSQPFVSHSAIQEQHINSSTNSPVRVSMLACMHFSLYAQSTIGYDGMIPLSRSCVFVNALQLLTIFWITASSISD